MAGWSRRVLLVLPSICRTKAKAPRIKWLLVAVVNLFGRPLEETDQAVNIVKSLTTQINLPLKPFGVCSVSSKSQRTIAVQQSNEHLNRAQHLSHLVK